MTIKVNDQFVTRPRDMIKNVDTEIQSFNDVVLHPLEVSDLGVYFNSPLCGCAEWLRFCHLVYMLYAVLVADLCWLRYLSLVSSLTATHSLFC